MIEEAASPAAGPRSVAAPAGVGSGQGPGREPLSEAFWNVARRLRHATRDAVAPWDVTPSHARALAVMLRHGPMRLSELSEHLHIAARSVTEVVDGLAERGLAQRRPDPHDRRATLAALTAEGQRVAEAVWSARTTEAEAFFGVLSAADRAELARILELLQA